MAGLRMCSKLRPCARLSMSPRWCAQHRKKNEEIKANKKKLAEERVRSCVPDVQHGVLTIALPSARPQNSAKSAKEKAEEESRRKQEESGA